MSIKKYANNKKAVMDSQHFRGAKLSALQDAQELVAEAVKNDTESYAQKLGITQIDSVKDVNDRALRNIGMVMDCLKTGKKLSAEEMRQ